MLPEEVVAALSAVTTYTYEHEMLPKQGLPDAEPLALAWFTPSNNSWVGDCYPCVINGVAFAAKGEARLTFEHGITKYTVNARTETVFVRLMYDTVWASTRIRSTDPVMVVSRFNVTMQHAYGQWYNVALSDGRAQLAWQRWLKTEERVVEYPNHPDPMLQIALAAWD